jgi:hypothetical protein
VYIVLPYLIACQALVPSAAEDLVCWPFARVGRLSYTEGQSHHSPLLGWFSLGGSRLLLLLHGADRVENIDLRKIKELCESLLKLPQWRY